MKTHLIRLIRRSPALGAVLAFRLDELTTELKAVVDAELVAGGKAAQGAVGRRVEIGP